MKIKLNILPEDVAHICEVKGDRPVLLSLLMPHLNSLRLNIWVKKRTKNILKIFCFVIIILFFE